MSALPSIEGGGGGSNTNGVSRCSSGEQPVGVEGSGQHFFNFPQAHADVKMEHMAGLHKPKPVTPGVYPVAMPFLQVAHMPQGMYSGYPACSADMNGFMVTNMGEEHESNRNNNNSNIGFSHPMVAAGWHGNPIHLIPPSPLFMAPTGTWQIDTPLGHIQNKHYVGR